MSECCVRFQRIAGSSQVVIRSAEDLRAAASVDPAFWAVMGLPTDSILFDPDFIRFMDSDQSGRVSPKELLSGLRWMLGLLSDLSGTEQGSDTLKLDAISQEIPEGVAMKANAELILKNIGKAEAKEITLAEVSERKNLISDPLCNGDGIIPPPEEDPETAGYIQAAIACSGSVPDLSGIAGIDEEKLKDFHSKLLLFRDWSEKKKDTLSYGPDTPELYPLYVPLKQKITEFFSCCELVSMNRENSADRFGAIQKVDPLDLESMAAFMKKAPIAIPEKDGSLSLSGWVNPEQKTELETFLSKAFERNLTAKKGKMSREEWQKMDAALTPYAEWLTAAPAVRFPDLTEEQVAAYSDGRLFTKVMEMINEDRKVKALIDSYDSLKKLIIYQKFMLEFLNNYISLERLFDPEHPSMVQPGHLVMDGRHFTLCTMVTNLNEHKKIILRSEICVMYVEAVTGVPKAVRKMTLAVAVTSGSMRNIFVGKTGIFIGRDGVEWYAKVIDLVQQPVSLSEALQQPFFRLGELLTKQADKFFSAKSKAAEDKALVNLQNSTDIPKTAKQQTPAVSGSMLLMGGGVGIAAIGSAFAFIANTLKGISVLNVLTVFFGILLVIALPVLFVSVIKLMNRKVSDFLAASGWAVNPKMRLSREMGAIFTHVPDLGLPEKMLYGDMVKTFSKRFIPKTKHGAFLLILLILLILAGAAYGYLKGASCFGWPLPGQGSSIRKTSCCSPVCPQTQKNLNNH